MSQLRISHLWRGEKTSVFCLPVKTHINVRHPHKRKQLLALLVMLLGDLHKALGELVNVLLFTWNTKKHSHGHLFTHLHNISISKIETLTLHPVHDNWANGLHHNSIWAYNELPINCPLIISAGWCENVDAKDKYWKLKKRERSWPFSLSKRTSFLGLGKQFFSLCSPLPSLLQLSSTKHNVSIYINTMPFNI